MAVGLSKHVLQRPERLTQLDDPFSVVKDAGVSNRERVTLRPLTRGWKETKLVVRIRDESDAPGLHAVFSGRCEHGGGGRRIARQPTRIQNRGIHPIEPFAILDEPEKGYVRPAGRQRAKRDIVEIGGVDEIKGDVSDEP